MVQISVGVVEGQAVVEGGFGKQALIEVNKDVAKVTIEDGKK